MDIDVLINILTQAKNDGVKKVKIIVKDNDFDLHFSSEGITGISFNFEDSSIILIPQCFY